MKKYFLISLIIFIAAILRFYKLGSTPPSLYWDEASLGYNAYSILKTGHDEYGKFLPTTNFAAFGDYKPPGYIYAAVPSIALFGLSEFAVRFPSALFGTLTVLLTYLLVKELFEENYQLLGVLSAARPTRRPRLGLLNHEIWSKYLKLPILRFPLRALSGIPSATVTPRFSNWKLEIYNSETIALLAALFLAISPWHLQFSRGAFEANLGLFFSTLGIYLFIKFAKDKPIFILPSVLSFLAAMYTFTGQRLFVPFILLVLALQFKKQILSNFKIAALTAVISAILFWPLFKFAIGTIEGRLRFEEVTIFKDLDPINQSTKYRARDNFSFISSIIHNRRLFYVNEYLRHYLDAFNPSFLFIRGDVNPRLSIGELGELYPIDLIFVLAGIYFLFSTNQKYRFLIIGWLLVSGLGPATARETPHALRMIHILPTYQIIAAFGAFNIYQLVKFKKTFLAVSFAIIAVSFLYYLHMYYFHWPKEYSGEWQYGYKQAVRAAKTYYDEVDYIVVTKSLGRPYIYFLFYNQYDPRKYWQNSKVTRDQFYFLDVKSFDKFIFTDDLAEMPKSSVILRIASPEQISGEGLQTIKGLNGKEVFKIGKVVVE